MSSKKTLMNELIDKQLKNINQTKKFGYNDITRIVKNIDKSIFGNECSLWGGYVANIDRNKSPYINFYFRERKLALHRLLYYNYIGPISENEYIKFSCDNKGKCCTLKHFIKYEKDYNPTYEVMSDESSGFHTSTDEDESSEDSKNSEDEKEDEKESKNKKQVINMDSKFTISFD
jgi:hypothetical protein